MGKTPEEIAAEEKAAAESDAEELPWCDECLEVSSVEEARSAANIDDVLHLTEGGNAAHCGTPIVRVGQEG